MEISRQIKKTTTIIDKPLNIGAEDLLRGVEYTFCGDLHLYDVWILRKKWEHRYCIISQGCLYIYSDKTSKKTKLAYPLKVFDSAQACEPQEGESFCIQLVFKNAKTPLLFSCDTDKRREEWMEHFCSSIAYVQSQTYNLSADSGFGSAETVPKHNGPEQVEEAYQYVTENRFPKPISQPEDATKENSRHYGKSNTSNNDIYYENATTTFTESNRKQRHVKTIGKVKQVSNSKETDRGTTQVKELTGSSHAEKTKQMSIPLPHVVMDELKSRFEENGVSKTYEMTSIQATSGSSFLYVRGGATSKISEDTIKLSDREHEDLYVNRDSGDSSPEIVYENTEPKKFQKKDYFSTEKKQMKKELVLLPVGSFAVCPGDSNDLELSVKTETGLKCFPIYTQNGMVSLFKSHQYNRFSSLDDLLSFYVMNPLPSSNYSVRLVRGYRS